MLYCDTTAFDDVREMLAMPPRIGSELMPAAVIGSVCRAPASRSDARRLHHDRIRHAVVRVEPVGRRHLRTAGQVDDQAVGHVALGQPDVLGPRPVHIHIESGIALGLLDAGIGNARDVTDFAQQLIGIGEVGRKIGAADLQVDWRRRAEVEESG